MNRRRKKGASIAAIALLGFWLASCDTTDTDTPPAQPPEEPGLVAFAAYFEDVGIARLAIAPFDDPSNYRFISDEVAAFFPRFTRDKTKLLFTDYDSLFFRQKVLLYDVEQDTTIHLTELEADNLAPRVESETLTWNDDGSGFYFDLRGGVAGIRVTYSYTLGDSAAVLMRNDADPVEFIGRDTLIVRGWIQPRGFAYFFMDARTGALSPMTNPHLDRYAANIPTARSIAWDDERRLLVVSVPDSVARRATLALTDLDGTFFRALTEQGPYRDAYPRWGPDGTVLFNRIPDDEILTCGGRILIVKTETGEMRDYLPPEMVEGASHLCHPDY